MSEKRITAKQKGSNNFLLINSTYEDLTTKLQDLASRGQLDEAARLLKMVTKGIEAQHPVFPYWTYRLTIGESGNPQFRHVPVNEEAARTHPMRFVAGASIPDHYGKCSGLGELMRQAYGKQECLEFDVEYFQVLIGETIVEEHRSDEAGDIECVMRPQEFPPPFPAKLYFRDSDVSIDYFELRLQRIEGSIYTLSNVEQERTQFLIMLVVDMEQGKATLKVSITEAYTRDVKTNLLFCRFMKEASGGTGIRLKVLKEGRDLLVSETVQLSEEYDEGIGLYLSMLESLARIEDHCDVKFGLTEEISDGDFRAINLLLLAMDGGKRSGTYTDITLTASDKETVCNVIDVFAEDGKPLQNLTLAQSASISLFGETLEFEQFVQTFWNPKLDGIEKLKEKYQLMEDGETIKIEFIPREDMDNLYEEYLVGESYRRRTAALPGNPEF